MPEGDSLRRAEAALAPILEDQLVISIWFRKLRGYRPRAGMRIASVDAVGKHLLIGFDTGSDRPLILRTHLGMAGSWRTIGADAPVPRSPSLRIVIGTALGTALCFSAPEIETFVAGRPSAIDRLGPDLSDDDRPVDEVVAAVVVRTRRLADATQPLADVLLDQRIAAGVGNVFKSEALFVAAAHPFTAVGEVGDDTLAAVWEAAHRQLVANRERPSRSTTGRPSRRERTYVYGRHRLGCRVCDAAIEFDAAGSRTSRSTYWCPRCQAVRTP